MSKPGLAPALPPRAGGRPTVRKSRSRRARVVLGTFRTAVGGFTLANLAGLMTGPIRSAPGMSLQLRLWTAALGCGTGRTLAYLYFQTP